MKEPDSMKEIHDIMEKLYNKRVSLTEEEIIREIRDGAEKFRNKYGLKTEKVQLPKSFELTKS